MLATYSSIVVSRERGGYGGLDTGAWLGGIGDSRQKLFLRITHGNFIGVMTVLIVIDALEEMIGVD
jgi:hypothetical protein